MASLFVLPTADVGSGIKPPDGAKLFFFETGTTTPKNTYTDAAATTPHANPVVSDSKGVFPAIFMTGSYKVRLTDKNNVQIWEEDPVDEFLISSSSAIRPLPDGYTTSILTETRSPDVFESDFYDSNETTGSGAKWVKTGGAGTPSTQNNITRTIYNANGDEYKNMGGSVVAAQFGITTNPASTGNTAIIADLLISIINGGFSTDIQLPPGKVRFDTGFTVDVSVARLTGTQTELDFSNLSTGAAVTFIGGARVISGAPFLNALNAIEGIEFMGPGKAVVGTIGLDFTDNDIQGANDVNTQRALVHDFETGIRLGDNAYHLTFDDVSVFFCGTCVQGEQFSNAGARSVFTQSRFFNSENAFNLENASSGSTSVTDCVIAGIDTLCFRITGGHLTVSGCDIEPGNSHGSDYRPLWVDGTTNRSYVTWYSNNVSVKNATIVPVFGVDSPCELTVVGGLVFTNPASTGGLFGSAGTGSGRLVSYNLSIDIGTNPIEKFNGAGFTNHRQISNLNSISTDFSFTSSADVKGDTIISDTGEFFNDTASFTVTALSTWTDTGYAGASGLLILRDGSLGGTAVYMCDPSSGAVSIQNSITGLTVVGYNAGILSIQLTSGSVPRTIRKAIVRVQ